MKIWVMTIDHKHGTDIYAAVSESTVMQRLVDYVDRWWDVEHLKEERPEDDQEAIDLYFELVEYEHFMIDLVPLED